MKSLSLITIIVCGVLSGLVIYFFGAILQGLVGYIAGVVSALAIALALIIEADEISIHDKED